MSEKNRMLSANLVYTCAGAPLRNGVVEVGSDGVVISVSGPNDTIPHVAGLEYFPGILIPGIISVGTDDDILELSEEFVSNSKEFRKLWSSGFQVISASDCSGLDWKALLSVGNFEQTLIEHTLLAALNCKRESQFGSIESGKHPGIMHLTAFDFKSHKLTENTVMNRIV